MITSSKIHDGLIITVDHHSQGTRQRRVILTLSIPQELNFLPPKIYLI